MATNKLEFQGYQFHDGFECERAKKEWEVIESIKKNADLNNANVAIQIYDKAVSEKTFHTVIGYDFLKQLRDTVKGLDLAMEQEWKPIVVYKEDKGYVTQDVKELKRYQSLYDACKANSKRLKIVIGFLIALIIGIFIITYKTQYSVFTYFKDYEAEIENRVINQYSDWKSSLEEKEKELNQREAELSSDR